MKKLFLVLAVLFVTDPAWAQNPTCPTRPPGTSDNSCASTAFVANVAGTGTYYVPLSVCNGVADASATIQAAVTSGIADIVIPAGTCLWSSASQLTLASNQTIRGVNKFSSIIKLNVNPTFSFFRGATKTGFAIKNLTVDYNNKTPGGVNGVFDIDNSAFFSINNLRIIHMNKIGFGLANNTDFDISENYIQKDSIDAANLNVALLLTSAGGINQRAKISRNYVVNTSLGGDTLSDSIISENTVVGFGYGAAIALAFATAGNKNNIVTRNILSNGSTDIDGAGTRLGGIENYSANSVITDNIIYNNGGSGIHNGGPYTIVANNSVYNNGQRSLVGGCASICTFGGIENRYVNVNQNSQFSNYSGNISSNSTGTPSQTWAYAEVNNPVYRFLHGNVFPSGVTATASLGSGNYLFYLGPALQGTFTYNPASIAAGAGLSNQFTLAGTFTTDWVSCSFSNDLQGLTLTAYVAGNNDLTVRLFNSTVGAIDLASGTLSCSVYKPIGDPAL